MYSVDREERVLGILFGGPHAGSVRSVYTALFDRDNATWLSRVLGPSWGQDLDEHDENDRFGNPR